MKLDGDVSFVKSYMGALASLLVTLTILGFTYTKLITIANKNDVDIMSALIDGRIDYNTRFDAENDGFFIAAALTEYDTNTEVIEEARYGELVIEHHGWGYEDNIAVEERQI